MQFFTMAILFACAIGGDTTCITIHHLTYETEVLKTDIETPYQLAIDYDTNTLFFSYTARSEEMFKSAYLSLKTGEFGIVTGIRAGFANAVNSEGSTVYMGGEDGVYTFDYKTKKATNLHILNEAHIWQMFYNYGLYFTTYPEEKAYFYKNDQVVEVPALQNVKVVLLAVTNDKDFVYSNSSGVYFYGRDENKTIILINVMANGITSDIKGDIYFSSPNGIYYFNDETKEVECLAKLKNIYGVAIESNGNFIYSESSSIIRLKSSKKVCKDTNKLPKLVKIDIGK